MADGYRIIGGRPIFAFPPRLLCPDLRAEIPSPGSASGERSWKNFQKDTIA